MIYFAQAGEGAPVKIGYAANPTKRLTELQTAHYEVIRMLLVIDGDERHEAFLHEKFAALRLRGEWFRPASELLTFIAKPEPLPEMPERVSRQRSPALMAALASVGGVSALAAATRVTRQAISQWDEVPPLQVLAVERASGVPRHELRPDIFGAPGDNVPDANAGQSAA